MPYIADAALDAALNNINDGDRVDICSQEPANYTEATSTYSLGNETGVSVGSPTDGDSSGRKVVIPAITDGDVTDDGTATHWALSDVTGTELKAAESLTSSQSVTDGNTFSLNALDIEFPDPT
jgi:hypothetical protein